MICTDRMGEMENDNQTSWEIPSGTPIREHRDRHGNKGTGKELTTARKPTPILDDVSRTNLARAILQHCTV